MSDLVQRLAAFAVATLVVGLLAASVGFVLADGPSPGPDATVDKPYYTNQSLVDEASLAPAEGEIEVQQGDATVLVHQSGGDLEPIERALVRSGHEVHTYTGGQARSPMRENPLNRSLADADAFLTVGAGGFSDAEMNGIEAFADAGGRVLIAHDTTSGGGATIPSAGVPAMASGGGSDPTALTSRFGVTVGSGYLYNMQENDENHQRVFATASGNGELAADVDRLVLDTASPVYSESGTAVATTGERTHYSVSREAGSYGVASRSGDVVVLGNTAVFDSLDYNRADNEVLLGNLLTFLTSGQKLPDDAPAAGSSGPGQPGGPGGSGPTQPPATNGTSSAGASAPTN